MLYSGARYRASISPWVWDHPKGGKGASLNLHNVLWVDDGEVIGGPAYSGAEDDFADLM